MGPSGRTVGVDMTREQLDKAMRLRREPASRPEPAPRGGVWLVPVLARMHARRLKTYRMLGLLGDPEQPQLDLDL